MRQGGWVLIPFVINVALGAPPPSGTHVTGRQDQINRTKLRQLRLWRKAGFER